MARRTVVGERNSIEHKLGLVFRPARMEDGIALVQPSRLRIHQVLQRAAWQRRDPIGNRLRANLVDRADAMGIDERVVGLHLDGCLEGNQAEFDELSGRSCGTNFNRLRGGSEGCVPDFQVVDPKRKTLHHQIPRSSVRKLWR